MLIDFTLRNFLSFKEEVSFSMLTAKSVKEHEQYDSNGLCNVINVPNTDSKLLKVATIYGANGSGKSNLLSAMSFFKHMVLDSFKNDSILHKMAELSYQFSVESQEEPNSFEMMFIIEDKRYRYGFEIFNKSIESEWLFIKPLKSSRESYCFKREKKNILVNSKTYKGAGGISSKTRHNALFLSTCAQFNVEISMTIKEWFRKRFNILSGIDDDTIHYTASQYIRNTDMRNRIIEFIKIIDEHTVEMRVWERGTGETLACGTGACATVVACVLNGLTGEEVTVKLLGGDLQIQWDREENLVYMTGPAEIVFEGEVEI